MKTRVTVSGAVPRVISV